MRYTTIIDISEYPSLYRNLNIRLVYLHLCLASGYHDDDRDLYQGSIRTLARQTGLTIAAVRHALDQLLKASMVVRQGPLWQVRKFVIERPITPRAKSRKQEQRQQALDMQEQERLARDQERQAYEAKAAELRARGKTSFMVYYEQQMELARAGDPNAISFVKSNETMYKQHAAQVAKDNSKSQSL